MNTFASLNFTRLSLTSCLPRSYITALPIAAPQAAVEGRKLYNFFPEEERENPDGGKVEVKHEKHSGGDAERPLAPNEDMHGQGARP